MRRRTRNAILVILGVVVVLLALGAVPGLLKSGDPYYLTATETDTATLAADNRTAVNVTAISPRRYPYTTAALANATGGPPGRSDPYWKGPFGVKEAFTHSPFDELDALTQRNGTAAVEGGVYVQTNGTVYRLAITQDNV